MAQELLAGLRRRGVILEVNGEQLRYRPKDRVTVELRATIQEHKADLLALLQGPQEPPPVVVEPFQERIELLVASMTPCRHCGQIAWRRGGPGGWTCSVCHPGQWLYPCGRCGRLVPAVPDSIWPDHLRVDCPHGGYVLRDDVDLRQEGLGKLPVSPERWSALADSGVDPNAVSDHAQGLFLFALSLLHDPTRAREGCRTLPTMWAHYSPLLARADAPGGLRGVGGELPAAAGGRGWQSPS